MGNNRQASPDRKRLAILLSILAILLLAALGARLYVRSHQSLTSTPYDLSSDRPQSKPTNPADRPDYSTSGIKGEVILGAITDCYSTDPNSSCGKPKPLQATIDIKSTTGETKSANQSERVVATVSSDQNGQFSVNLESGTYIVAPRPFNGLHALASQTVTVTAGTFVTITIVYD